MVFFVSVDAGLPNITGVFGHALMTETFISNGSFYDTSGNTWSRGTSSPSTWKWRDINIDASRSSSVYGSSDTVTPLSLSCIPIIRY